MKWYLSWCVVLCCAGLATAGERVRVSCGARQVVRGDQVVDTGLVVVPFAIPVAVPVATVVRPSVVYGYGAGVATPFGAWGKEMRAKEFAAVSAEEVLVRRCAECHAGSAAAGGMRWFDEEGALLERLPRWRMWESVESGAMPEGGERLTEEELRLLREWARPPRELVY